MSLHNAYRGSLVADALAMPVHWYYDREALRREYGVVDQFMAPKHPHTGSFMFRMHYEPINEKADILHDQAKYWGQAGVHYHRGLQVGENTINYQLAKELFRQVRENGVYDPERWAKRYIECMRTPGWHNDTHLEEYHRGFFNRYAQGKEVTKCGISDEHIGGLAQVPALLAALPADADWRRAVKEHVALTHRHSNVLRAADCLARLLHAVARGMPVREAISSEAGDWISGKKAEKWSQRPDNKIIGQVFSPACYIDQSFPAALFLVWKYHNDFDAGIIANTMAGGDNCHRGAVVGSVLGLANGVGEKWLEELEQDS